MSGTTKSEWRCRHVGSNGGHVSDQKEAAPAGVGVSLLCVRELVSAYVAAHILEHSLPQ